MSAISSLPQTLNSLNAEVSDLSSMLLDETGQQLRIPGQFWSDRLVEGQQDLVRAMASLSTRLTKAQRFAGLSAYGAAYRGLPAFDVLFFAQADLVIQGPDTWGYDPETGEPLILDPTPEVSGKRRPWLLADGRVVESEPGEVLTLPVEPLHEQTTWFVPNLDQAAPSLIWAETKILVEGQGFLNRGAWLVLFENPLELWPDGHLPCMATPRRQSWRSGALRADFLQASGRKLGKYQRNNQTPKALELALCELANIPILETEGIVAKIEQAEGLIRHWLTDGRQFTLPGATPYAVGSLVPANDGHILRIRCEATHGENWWSSRYWGVNGVPIHIFRPEFLGFAIKDEVVPLEISLADTLVRARLVLQLDVDGTTAANTYWAWQKAQENRMESEAWAVNALQIDPSDLEPALEANGSPMLQTDGDPIMISSTEGTLMRNALGSFASVCGSWFGVVETSLDIHDPVAFSRIMDYAERDRPSGMLLYFAGQSAAYTNANLFAEYVDTGILQLDKIDPRLCQPPH